jgi:hypothetical protein
MTDRTDSGWAVTWTLRVKSKELIGQSEVANVFFCRLMCLWVCLHTGAKGEKMRSELVVAGTYNENVAFGGQNRREKSSLERQDFNVFFCRLMCF